MDKSLLLSMLPFSLCDHIALSELVFAGMGALGTDFSSRLFLHKDSFSPFIDVCQVNKLLFLCLLSPRLYICKSIFEKDHNSLTHVCQAVALLGPHFTMQSTVHIDPQGIVQDLPFWKVSGCSKLKGCILHYSCVL